ncbi:hypothetical protein pb186bvf_019171 [Paramecium bursaria]
MEKYNLFYKYYSIICLSISLNSFQPFESFEQSSILIVQETLIVDLSL